MVDLDIGRFKRLFPFSLGVKECEDCGAWMEEDYVRDPYTQSHFRGVLAWVCPDCGRKERKEEPGERKEGWS